MKLTYQKNKHKHIIAIFLHLENTHFGGTTTVYLQKKTKIQRMRNCHLKFVIAAIPFMKHSSLTSEFYFKLKIIENYDKVRLMFSIFFLYN